MHELKASPFEGGQALGDFDHVADTVTLLNPQPAGAVLRIVIVILICHQPFVYAEDSTGFQHSEDLLVYALQAWCVHGRFNRVHGVEAVFREAHLHEISFGC